MNTDKSPMEQLYDAAADEVHGLRIERAKLNAEATRLRDQLRVAREALTAIAEYDTDFAKGPADNVGKLQTIAEAAIASLETP